MTVQKKGGGSEVVESKQGLNRANRNYLESLRPIATNNACRCQKGQELMRVTKTHQEQKPGKNPNKGRQALYGSKREPTEVSKRKLEVTGANGNLQKPKRFNSSSQYLTSAKKS